MITEHRRCTVLPWHNDVIGGVYDALLQRWPIWDTTWIVDLLMNNRFLLVYRVVLSWFRNFAGFTKIYIRCFFASMFKAICHIIPGPHWVDNNLSNARKQTWCSWYISSIGISNYNSISCDLSNSCNCIYKRALQSKLVCVQQTQLLKHLFAASLSD